VTEIQNAAPVKAESVETVKILITDKLTREGGTLLYEQPAETQIDERLALKPGQLKAIISDYVPAPLLKKFRTLSKGAGTFWERSRNPLHGKL